MDFKEAHMIHAEQDLAAARILFDAGIYNLVLYLCQQAVEKAAKAYMGYKGIVVGKTHVVSPIMRSRVLGPGAKEEMVQAVEYIDALEEYVSVVRYPLQTTKRKGEYEDPRDVYTRSMAEEALAMAESVMSLMRSEIARLRKG